MSLKLKAFLAFFVLAPLLALVPASFLIYDHWNWEYEGEKTTFEVKSGEGFASVNRRLKDQGLIRSPRILYYYARHFKLMEKLRVGLYEINPGMKMKDIIGLLISGKGIMRALTVPEGKNIYEVATIIESSGFGQAKEFLSLINDRTFVETLGIEAKNLEGYLYPETYHFNPGISLRQITQSMIDQFQIKTRGLDISKSQLSWHQILTLSSIVEKETGAGFERPKIAGVFINRLKKGMRLQSDPTIIYGIWERYDGNIRKSDLLEKTAYNTYQIDGLPPGPICNPGIESIEAVLNPEQHDFLFFVSFNDGTHKFSKTYSEHLKAVQDYQINRKAREGKSWRDLDPTQRSRR